MIFLATKVYLDTWLLRALVSKKKHDRMYAKREISRLHSNSFEVVVPQIVLGEAFSTIMRDYNDPNDAHNRLTKLYEQLKLILEPRNCLPPLTSEIINLAREIKNRDSNLHDTDILITAHALLDPYSERLLTNDKDLMNSKAVKEIEAELRESKIRKKQLKIVDGL